MDKLDTYLDVVAAIVLTILMVAMAAGFVGIAVLVWWEVMK